MVWYICLDSPPKLPSFLGIIWVFPKIEIPQNGWFIMENPIKIDDLGVPLFSETSIYIHTFEWTCGYRTSKAFGKFGSKSNYQIIQAGHPTLHGSEIRQLPGMQKKTRTRFFQVTLLFFIRDLFSG